MKAIVNFTPTGMIPTKEMTPHVPISVSEIVESVHEAVEIGITIVHLHARDAKTGLPTPKAEVYGKIIEGIRGFSTDLIVCVSLSGRNFPEFELRSEPLQLDGNMKPDMGSLTLSSLNFNRQASINEPKTIIALAAEMQRREILPELEAFDVGMINYGHYLIRKGLLKSPHYFNLIVGNIACAQPNLLHVGTMIQDLPSGSIWSLGGIGDAQISMNGVALAMGGGVRVGLEDNIWFDTARTKLATNGDLLRRIQTMIAANDRELMPSLELRSLLGLQGGNGCYGTLAKS